MGRVKVPRCDNCGAPVEFGKGVLEARCVYCGEVLIRELPAHVPEPAPRTPRVQYAPPASPARSKFLWPLLIAGGAIAMAGASAIAAFANQQGALSSSVPEFRAASAVMHEERRETQSFSFSTSETRSGTSQLPKAAEAGTSRPRSLKPKPPVAPVPAPTPIAPPKPPRFDTPAAVAGLDAAKVKAEQTCKSTTVKSLFVQMGFDADGKNRGAALSNPQHNGTPEAKCVLKVFRAVSIPAFDPATKPGGLGRAVRF